MLQQRKRASHTTLHQGFQTCAQASHRPSGQKHPPSQCLGCTQERGFDLGKRFKGEVTMAGKDKGKDCSVGTQDLTGKVNYQ